MAFINPVSQWVAGKMGEWAAAKVDTILFALNNAAPDVVTYGVVFCALAMMVTGSPYKWFGRAMMLLWVGIVWIVL